MRWGSVPANSVFRSRIVATWSLLRRVQERHGIKGIHHSGFGPTKRAHAIRAGNKGHQRRCGQREIAWLTAAAGNDSRIASDMRNGLATSCSLPQCRWGSGSALYSIRNLWGAEAIASRSNSPHPRPRCRAYPPGAIFGAEAEASQAKRKRSADMGRELSCGFRMMANKLWYSVATGNRYQSIATDATAWWGALKHCHTAHVRTGASHHDVTRPPCALWPPVFTLAVRDRGASRYEARYDRHGWWGLVGGYANSRRASGDCD